MDIKIEGLPPSRMITLTEEVTVAPFFAHALAATLAVIGLPVAIALSLTFSTSSLPPWVPGAAAVGLSIGASAIGTLLWRRAGASDAVEFGELMLWSWLRRNSAERRIKLNSVELGLEPTGVVTARLPRARRLELLRDLTDSLQTKDSYTRGHSSRVERLVYRCAMAMGMDAGDTHQVRVAASVHDVGKIYIPDEILRKPDALTRLEYETVKEHAARGGRMVEALGDPGLTAAVRHHHERWDGTGYPDGLVAHEIPRSARLIAVADTYDAMTSTRTYRAKRSHRKAIAILESEKGKQLDPEIVDAFVATARERSAAYLSALVFLLPQDALAAAGSWLRRRSSALGAVAIALVAAVLSASITGDPTLSPATEIAAPSGGESDVPVSDQDRSGRRPPADRPPRERATAPDDAVIEDPGQGEVVVLGTRVEAPQRRDRDGVDLDRGPAVSRTEEPQEEPAVQDVARTPPGHAGKGDDPPPGRSADKPGRGPKGTDSDRSSQASRGRGTCKAHPGKGLARGRTSHC